MCKIIDKTCLSPTPTLEQHLMWDDIAILARYMLMLSFNNSLDVAAHLPYLFHVVTLLVATGPLSLRASTHGLVINIIHSLCTCSQLNFSGENARACTLAFMIMQSVIRSVSHCVHTPSVKKTNVRMRLILCTFTIKPLEVPYIYGPCISTILLLLLL